MILALFYYVALLRLILHCLLPPASRFPVTVASKWLVCAEGRNLTHLLAEQLFGEWRLDLSFGCWLQPHGRELTGSSRSAAWHRSDLALGWILPKHLWHPAARSACHSPLSASHPATEAAEASTWPCLTCSALQNAWAYVADLMALRYDCHIQTGETKMHTRPVSVNSARRAVTAEVEGNC